MSKASSWALSSVSTCSSPGPRSRTVIVIGSARYRRSRHEALSIPAAPVRRTADTPDQGSANMGTYHLAYKGGGPMPDSEAERKAADGGVGRVLRRHRRRRRRRRQPVRPGHVDRVVRRGQRGRQLRHLRLLDHLVRQPGGRHRDGEVLPDPRSTAARSRCTRSSRSCSRPAGLRRWPSQPGTGRIMACVTHPAEIDPGVVRDASSAAGPTSS